MHAIITQGLYISNPLFEGQKRFSKEFFFVNLWPCMVKYEGYNGAGTIYKNLEFGPLSYVTKSVLLKREHKKYLSLIGYMPSLLMVFLSLPLNNLP
jgi:hypothetical protein